MAKPNASPAPPEPTLELALSGLEGLFDPNGHTDFHITESVFTPSVGKAEWVEKQLPSWIETLKTISGVGILNWKLHRPLRVPDQFGNYTTCLPQPGNQEAMSRVIIGARILGRVKTFGIRSDIAVAISGAVKRELALMILQARPLPFDPNSPLLPAGTTERLRIERGGTTTSKTVENLVIEQVHEAIAKSGAMVLGTICNNRFSSYHLDIRWLHDITDSKRGALQCKINAIFAHNLWSNPDVFLEAW